MRSFITGKYSLGSPVARSASWFTANHSTPIEARNTEVKENRTATRATRIMSREHCPPNTEACGRSLVVRRKRIVLETAERKEEAPAAAELVTARQATAT